MHALNLSEDNRVLSVCELLPNSEQDGKPVISIENGKYNGMEIVKTLPDGDLYEYKYINGEFIHDPLPEEPIVEEPTIYEIMDALLGVV